MNMICSLSPLATLWNGVILFLHLLQCQMVTHNFMICRVMSWQHYIKLCVGRTLKSKLCCCPVCMHTNALRHTCRFSYGCRANHLWFTEKRVLWYHLKIRKPLPMFPLNQHHEVMYYRAQSCMNSHQNDPFLSSWKNQSNPAYPSQSWIPTIISMYTVGKCSTNAVVPWATKQV